MSTYASETFETFIFDLSNLAFNISISLFNDSTEDIKNDSECEGMSVLVISNCLLNFEIGL